MEGGLGPREHKGSRGLEEVSGWTNLGYKVEEEGREKREEMGNDV